MSRQPVGRGQRRLGKGHHGRSQPRRWGESNENGHQPVSVQPDASGSEEEPTLLRSLTTHAPMRRRGLAHAR